MTKSVWIWIAVFGGTFVALFFLIRATAPKDPNAVYPKVSVIANDDHVKGPAESAVTLVEYGDFQCPACAQYEPIVQELLTEFGARVRFVYRHFPLPQHKHAILAAQFSEAAGLQGKFWEMHDKLFTGQKTWEGLSDAKPTFLTYADELSLDIAKLEQDLASDSIKTRVERDRTGALDFNVGSTPTFFLNGKRIQPQNYDQFKSLIESTLGG